jgi:photosystem II stability/assembly factor-like uncharacterized protein
MTVATISQTWKPCYKGIENYKILSLAVKENNLYIGSGEGKVFFSSDNGNTWTEKDSIGSPIFCINIIDNKIFVGSSRKGIFLSTNEGQTWTAQNDSLPYSFMTALKIVENHIFALYQFPKGGGGGGRIVKSSDEGKTWTEVLAGKNQNWLNVMDVIDKKIFIGTSSGQILVSTDLGLNWSKVVQLPDKGITCLKSRNNELLVGTDEGEFLISRDFGLTLEKRNKGLPDDLITAIEYSEDNLYVGTAVHGIFISSDNGANWNDFSDTIYNKHVQPNCLLSNNGYLFFSSGSYIGLNQKIIHSVNVLEGSKINDTYKLYPNPAKDYLHVAPLEEQANSESNKIEILTELGIKVWQSNVFKDKIDISNLQIGVYFLRIGNKFYKFEKV